MKKLIGFLVFTPLVAFAQANGTISPSQITCEAQHRDVLSDGELKVVTEQMTTFEGETDVLQRQVIVEGNAYNISGEVSSGSLLLIISEGPDYITGMASRGFFDANNELNLSWVQGNKLYRLACQLTK